MLSCTRANGRAETVESVVACRSMATLLRQDLLLLSEQWLIDARTLLAAKRYPGAYHAGGLALECALKARIAKLRQAEEFPDKELAQRAWKHDPTELLKVAELSGLLDSASGAVQTNWATVKDWKAESRYTHSVNPATVIAFLDALDHPTDGVLPWLRSHC